MSHRITRAGAAIVSIAALAGAVLYLTSGPLLAGVLLLLVSAIAGLGVIDPNVLSTPTGGSRAMRMTRDCLTAAVLVVLLIGLAPMALNPSVDGEPVTRPVDLWAGRALFGGMFLFLGFLTVKLIVRLARSLSSRDQL